jgi:hypothetical protein
MLGRCAVLGILWVGWMEQNRMILEGASGEDVDHLWDIV